MEGQLFGACENGNILTFLKLYDKDNSILLQRTTGSLDTPLHLACRSKHNELASTILHLQPDMAMATNNKEDTPLHDACRVGNIKTVTQLLDACPCVLYMLNMSKESALSIACSCGHSEVALELCRRMNFCAWDDIGASCLLAAALKGDTDIVRKILRENPRVASRKDDNGYSALHLASRKGYVEVIKEFLGNDPDLCFRRDSDGRTPLHCAVISEQLPAIQEYLSERPVSFNSLLVIDLINIADNNGDTVLHLAAKQTCLEIIELLLSKNGLKVHTANEEGMTALDLLKQTPAHEDANVPIDNYRKRVIIKQLKARKRANPKSVTAIKQALIVVAGLIMAITYLAGLNPPGGLWQDSDLGNGRNHRPGKAIQSETAPWLFTVFLAFDFLGFMVSLSLIPIIMILQKEMVVYVNSLVVVALISIEVAFILGLMMISDHKIFYRVGMVLLVLVTSACIWWTSRKLKLKLKRSLMLHL